MEYIGKEMALRSRLRKHCITCGTKAMVVRSAAKLPKRSADTIQVIQPMIKESIADCAPK